MATAPLRHPPWITIPGLVHGFLPGRMAPDASVLLPRQVHGTQVVTADPALELPEADAIVTAASGTTVGVVTADCVPLMLVAPRERVVAAVHAGWRGAAAGIVERALTYLRDGFGVEPASVQAAIGPAIGACCYEVGPEVRAAFRQVSGDTTAVAWTRRDDRDVLDLRRAVQALLEAAGVRDVAILGPCTRCSPAYCSYRRDGSNAGRQVSIIGWA